MIQIKIPADLVKKIEITDPIYTFNEVMEQVDLTKYYRASKSNLGRPKYNCEKMLKAALFAFMENGYASLRNIEKLCKTDIRYIWLLDGEKAPTYVTVSNHLREYIGQNIETLFSDINKYLFEREGVDLSRLYIDGTKIEANANKYTWVWKKSCLKSRDKVYAKLTELINEINDGILSCFAVRIETRAEYAIEYLEEIIMRFSSLTGVSENCLRGRGHHKTAEQRQYDKLTEYLKRLKKYAEHIEICGNDRNSYSKTDHDATFMRVKRDYMGNDQLLPAYNMQIGVCDEYIAVVDAQQYASDMDCFVPLMNKFKKAYGRFPTYPVADAGYGSYNNYLFCEANGMEKYMKFTMFEKEAKDIKYRDNPYRAVNFNRNEDGLLLCPEGRKFEYLYDRHIKGNKYGRTEEIYKCESCEGCLRRAECTKGEGDRTIRMNRELTAIHNEVLHNLKSELGITLRTNRSIQAEGTFGSIKWNRSYKRAQRRGIESVISEFYLISIGFNLYKYHNKKLRMPIAV
ncbi:MAG: transposase [Acutalibacteraceae bacterium]